MTANRSLRVELDPGSQQDRITGQLHDERGEEHGFSSWLGLLTLLEAARARISSSPRQDVERNGEATE